MPRRKSFRKYVSTLISFANSRIRNTLRDRSNEFFAGEVTPELEELMRSVWQPLIGPDCDVIVLHIKKPKSATSLGISIEGFDWVRESEHFPVANGETTEPVSVEPRHFVQSIVPGGLLGSLNIIQPGDELLQVNGRRLRGMSRTNTVRCLRNLPSHIELVLSRSKHPSTQLGNHELAALEVHGEEPALELIASEVASLDTTYSDMNLHIDKSSASHTSDIRPPSQTSPGTVQNRVSDWVRRSVVDLDNHISVLEHSGATGQDWSDATRNNTAPYPMDSLSRSAHVDAFRRLQRSPQKRHTIGADLATLPRPRSGTYRVQDPRYRAKRPVWSSVPLLVQLNKSDRGFGFSLSEYEELPISETESRRRRRISLTLGRRQTSHPTPLSSPQKLTRSATLPRMDSSAGRKSRKGYILLVDSVVPNGPAHKDGRISIGDRLLFVNDRNLSRASLNDAVRALKSAPNGPCLLGISKMHLVPNVVEDSDQADGTRTVGDPALNATYGGYEALYVNTGDQTLDDGKAPSFPTENAKDHPLDFHVLPEDYQQTDLHGPYLEVPPVNRSCEQHVQIVLLSAPIGIKLDALAARGQDGCRIVQIFDGGAVHRSNALKPNDYITSLDGHTMRQITNLEAFQLLRQSSNRDGTVDITYFPAAVIAAHRMKHLAGAEDIPACAASDYHRNGQGQTYAEPFGFLEHVVIHRIEGENSWGLTLGGKESLPLLPENIKAHLQNPTCIASIKPESSAERCGCLQPGDIILTVGDVDVVHSGPAHVRHLLQKLVNQGVTEVTLGVRFCTISPDSKVIGSKTTTTTVAEVEMRPRISDRSHIGDKTDREDSPSSFSQMEAPEPLSEMESRDELNVLSRSIESPVSEKRVFSNGIIPGQLTGNNDVPPLSSIACPILSDESTTSDTPIDQKFHDPMLKSFRDGAGVPPVPPPRRFSKEASPLSVDDSICNLPIITDDRFSLYERDEPVGDQVIPVNIEIPYWPMVNGTGDSSSPKTDNLGIRLIGSSDPSSNATYIAGLTPGSVAAQNKDLLVGDEIVQVGQNCVVDLGRLMVGRCIARAVYQSIKQAAMEENLTVPTVRLVVRRNTKNLSLMVPTSPQDRGATERRDRLANGPVSPSLADGTRKTTAADEPSLVELTTEHIVSQKANPNQLPVPNDLLLKVRDVLDEPVELFNIFDTEIQRNENGYGIFIVNYGPQDKPGVFVSDLAPNGAAAQHGELCPNDRILAVNGEVRTDYDSTLSLMKQSAKYVRLTIARRKSPEPSHGTLSQPVATSSPAPSAATVQMVDSPAPIVPGKETLIQLERRSGSSWGFSVVGGKDTVLGSILVHTVHDGGIVAQDGRIAVGDRLLAVNGVDLRDVDHETGKRIIRNAGDTLRLLVYRDLPLRLQEADKPQELEVTLKRKPGENLGLSLFGRSPYSTGTAIAAIAAGTPAAQCGMLMPGDVVLEINGLDYRLAQYQEVASALKNAPGDIKLKIQREPPSDHPTHPPLALISAVLHV